MLNELAIVNVGLIRLNHCTQTKIVEQLHVLEGNPS